MRCEGEAAKTGAGDPTLLVSVVLSKLSKLRKFLFFLARVCFWKYRDIYIVMVVIKFGESIFSEIQFFWTSIISRKMVIACDDGSLT